ncbi:uncharacterized protein LOC110455419 isoform X1 [Mizuhopecten yessoensis]|uniref:uncharacterized protein LOC110455419 isoform X1 n=1 Tax=Mizuhopecten yessoensis TaxID=6573 RepID=UPI000B45E029|nr:uncharacterized protein LOC110455419 isoform X1 [Mizuhopecten yessoensis]
MSYCTAMATEEPMETEVFGGSQGTNPSTHHTSFATAQCVPPPRWTFSGLELILLLYFCKKSFDQLVKFKYVELRQQIGILHVYIIKDDSTKYVEAEFKSMNLFLNDLIKNEISIPNDVLLHRKKKLQEYVHKNNGQPEHRCFLHLSDDSRTCTLFAKRRDTDLYQFRLKHQIDDWMTDIKRSVPEAISYPHPNMNTVANDTHLTSSRRPPSYADSVRTNPKTVPANYQGSTTLGSSQNRHVASSSFSSPPMFSYKGLDVHTVHGSITKMKTKVDGVINAANDRLDHIGGVAFYIAEAAGERMEEHCKEIMKKTKKIAVSENVVTTAGRMRCKGIIHAVGPKWGDYQDKHCLDLLADTVEKALITAEKEYYSEVAMPAISAGIYGIPKSLCAAMYIKGITQFCRKPKSVSWLTSLYIVDISDDILNEIQKAYSNWEKDKKSIEPSELLKQESLVRPRSAFSKSMSLRGSAAGVGGNVTTFSGKGSSPLHEQQWTKGPDESIPGLMDKVRCYKTDDGSFCVKIYTGSITKVKSLDAIVCTADTSLSGLGPLSEAVADAGGYRYNSSFSSQKQKYHSKAIKGQAFVCSAGHLAVTHVVHIVIEQLVDTQHQSLIDYKNFILNGLHSMSGWKMRSVALPLLAGGFVQHDKGSIRKMCDILYEAVMDFRLKSGPGRSLREIHFVNRKPEITQAFVDCFNQHLSSIKKTPTGPAPSAGAGKSTKKLQHGEANSFSESSYGTKLKTHRGQGEVGNWASVKQGQRHTQSMILPKKTSSDGGTYNKAIDDLGFLSTNGGGPNFRGNKALVKNELREEEENLQLKEKCKTQKPVVRKRIQKNICAACDTKLESDNVSRLACGHSFCSIPCFIPMQNNPSCAICKEVEGATAAESEEDVTCVICMDTITDQKKLSCGHVFCGDCIMQSMAHKPACPVCGKIFGELEGDQPTDGTMTVTRNTHHSLPSYEAYGIIEIKYKFQDGIQQENHPQPGKPYKGTERRAFLPDNREGQKVLRLLQKAFDSRLTFTIGSSRTTGQEDVVTWNDIHHKTKRDGGAAKFGYPDPTYLSRVQDELAAKGITE